MWSFVIYIWKADSRGYCVWWEKGEIGSGKNKEGGCCHNPALEREKLNKDEERRHLGGRIQRDLVINWISERGVVDANP